MSLALCEGPVNFPSQRASHTKNASIWWRHHGTYKYDGHHVYGGEDEDGAAQQVHNDVPFGPASQIT